MAQRRTKKAAPSKRRKTTVASSAKRKSTAAASTSRVVIKAPWEEAKKFAVAGDSMTVLEVPWEMQSIARQQGAHKIDKLGWVIPTKKLTPFLELCKAKDYSWEKFVEDKINGVVPHSVPTQDTGSITLRPEQQEDVDTIAACWSAGGPEFLLANDTGTGKTVVGVAAVLRTQGDVVLVICPAPVIPAWRNTVKAMGDGGKQWIIISYESSKKLLKPPVEALKAKKPATRNKHIAMNGVPWFTADIVINDEAHKVQNPVSQQSRVTDHFMAQKPKALRMSATPGDPARLHYLKRGLAWATGDTVFTVGEKNFSDYVSWCHKNGITGIVPAPFGNGIIFDGSQDDAYNMNKVLFDDTVHGVKWGLKRVMEDWPEKDRVGVPMEFSAMQQQLYNMEWKEFKDTMTQVNKVRKSTQSSSRQVAEARMKGLAAQIRYRQKVGSLKAEFAVEFTKDLLDKGNQVVLSCIYHDTVDRISELLDKAGIGHVCLTGKNTSSRENDRVRFQTGEVKVLISSITTGVSYHANDGMVGGSSAPRKMVIVEPSYSATEALQNEGRAQRNGEQATCYYLFARETIDEKVVSTVLKKMLVQSDVLGNSDDSDLIKDLGQCFGFDLVEK